MLPRLLGLACLGLGLTSEGVAGYLLLTLPAAAAWQALAGHMLAVFPATLGICLLLPTHYRRPGPGGLAFISSSALFLPGLGIPGIALALLPGLHTARLRRKPAWAPLALPDLPFQPVHPVAPEQAMMRDGLASVLAHFKDPLQRQQAIMACRHLPSRHAIPLLRRGLVDATDEVRLLSYSMLNTIERRLDGQIQVLEATGTQDNDRHGNRAEALAGLYWEYAYLQLAQGSTVAFLLGNALAHLDQAIEQRSTTHRWLLRGRICQELGRYDAARTAFNQCERLGMDDDDLAPQRAELAFRLGRYREVTDQLHRLSPCAAAQAPLGPVMEYWQ